MAESPLEFTAATEIALGGSSVGGNGVSENSISENEKMDTSVCRNQPDLK